MHVSRGDEGGCIIVMLGNSCMVKEEEYDSWRGRGAGECGGGE